MPKLLFLFLIVFSAQTFAQTAESTPTPAPLAEPLTLPKLFLGATTGYITYIEPGFISMYGVMSGASANFEIPINDFMNLRLLADLYYGYIQYDGQLSDGTPLKAGANDVLGVLRVNYDGHFVELEKVTIFSFIGLGWRFLYDRVNSSYGYERDISYFFIPLGLRTEWRKSATQQIEFTVEYDPIVAGKVKSHLSDTNPNNPDVVNQQKSGEGYRLAFEWRFATENRWWSISPYYQWWSVDDSDRQPFTPGKLVLEPKNNSSQGGLSVYVGL